MTAGEAIFLSDEAPQPPPGRTGIRRSSGSTDQATVTGHVVAPWEGDGAEMRGKANADRRGVIRAVRHCLAVTLLGSVALSCSLFQRIRFEEPDVSLEAIEITGLDLSGVSLVLWLDVFNPNDYDLRTTRVEADLELEGSRFGRAQLSEAAVLGAGLHTRVGVPAEFSWQGLGAGARGLLERGSVRYQLDTRLRVETSFGGRNLTLRRRGEVPVTNPDS